MFARAAFLVGSLASAAAAQISIPLGKPPRQAERPRAPIEEAGPLWAATCKDWDDWDKPAPPVRIHANTYLVGTCGISAILIAGEDGHVLIDGGTEKGAELIANNIRSLGYQLTDVKYLLHSHEHIDHVGGIARLQQLTGAQLVASAPAAAVFETGTATADDPQVGMHPPFPAARVDRIIKDGDDVLLGNIRLFAISTPGHTPGALSWRWESCDGGVCRTMIYADSLSAVSRDDYKFSDHPEYLAAFRTSIRKIAETRCEILMTPHPSASAMRDRITGQKRLFDTEGCRNYAATLGKRLDERVAKEAAK
jgi:metallo-beta-lactamase class B